MKPDKAWFCIVVGVVAIALSIFAFANDNDLTQTAGRTLRGPSWLFYAVGLAMGCAALVAGIRALIAWKRR